MSNMRSTAGRNDNPRGLCRVGPMWLLRNWCHPLNRLRTSLGVGFPGVTASSFIKEQRRGWKPAPFQTNRHRALFRQAHKGKPFHSFCASKLMCCLSLGHAVGEGALPKLLCKRSILLRVRVLKPQGCCKLRTWGIRSLAIDLFYRLRRRSQRLPTFQVLTI